MTSQYSSNKPNLTDTINPDVFLNFYWSKKELYDFCTKYSLSKLGTKEELVERIKCFLTTGEKKKSNFKKTTMRDSRKEITLETKVINYKNDAATRKFFIKHIGNHFHFNSYLRQFASNTFQNKENLTYGDLVEGWIKTEASKKNPNYKPIIGKQFEYNQFMHDFFSNEKNKTKKEAIEAWNFIKKQPGKRDYNHYKKLKEI